MSGKKNQTQIFDLKLGEELGLDDYTKVLRVPGGWIYKFYQQEYIAPGELVYILRSTCFVPFSNDFE